MPKKNASNVQKDRRRILYLDLYAKGRSVAALKVVHMLEPDCENATVTRNHSHRFYELVVVMRGRGFHHIGGMTYPLRTGQVYLLFPGECHYYEYTEPLTLLTFMFDGHLLRRFRAELSGLPGYPKLFNSDAGKRHAEYRLDTALLAELDLQLNSIVHYGRVNVPGTGLQQVIAMTNVLVMILQTVNPDYPSRSDGGIGIAVSYMTRHYHQEISLGELARMTGLSETSFYRKFQREFQEPPIQWLLKLRLRNSLRYLVRSDMTIREIARTVGFSDPFYYSRQFRKFLGCTPSVYRERNHGLVQTVFEEKVSTEYRSPEI